MKKILLFLLLGISQTCFGQTTSVSKSTVSGDIVNGNFNMPSGTTIEFKSGSDILLDSGATAIGFPFADVSANNTWTGINTYNGNVILNGITSINGTLNLPSSFLATVPQGGTGHSSLTSGALLEGNGTGATTLLTTGTGVNSALGNSVNGASGLIEADSSSRYPALDGSQITNVASSSGANEDNRLARCATVEGGGMSASSTITLCNITGGPGNVNFLQLAINGASPDVNSIFNSTLNFTVDGTNLGSIPIGLFFMTYGNQGSNTSNTSLMTDNFAVTFLDGSQSLGAQRRIYIPFNSSCVITLTNGSSSTACSIFSQIQYRLGVIPTSAYGYSSRKKVIHFAMNNYVSLASTATLDILPTVTAAGQIDSVQMFISGIGIPTWLEGNPSIVSDGVTFAYGGTEDFFGSQYYSEGNTRPYSDSWGFSYFNQNTGVATTPTVGGDGTGMFRFFDKDPQIFNTSTTMTWPNTSLSSVRVWSLVTYYTTM